MTRLAKIVLIILGSVLALPAVLLLCVALLIWAGTTSSKIIDFHPSSFEAKAKSGFFYSIGDDLKYGDTIDVSAPALFHGTVKNFLVSPDATMIAATANGKLNIIRTDGALLRQIGSVDSAYRPNSRKPLGQQYVRDDDFQWSRDSKHLYFLKDQYYESKGIQLSSPKGELWVLNIDSGALAQVIKPFSSNHYFFGQRDTIYFSAPTPVGDLQLRSFDGRTIADVNNSDISSIASQEPFYSFSPFEMESILRVRGIDLHLNGQNRRETFGIGPRNYLQFSVGNTIEGPYYCPDMFRSVFLPGDRYFVLNTSHCENAHGQLLIDTITGQYQVIPKDTRVYLTLNTITYPNFRVTVDGFRIYSTSNSQQPMGR